MQELGELDRRHEDFTQRGLRVVAVSVDGLDDTAKMQQRFPHLIVLGDPQHSLTDAVHALHVGAGPALSDIATPTTFLLDAQATVRWTFRADRLMVRLTPDQLLSAIDAQPAR